MVRLLILILLFPVSLLCVITPPSPLLWPLSLYITENSWEFLVVTFPLLFWGFKIRKYQLAGTIVGVATFLLFLFPILDACWISYGIDKKFDRVFGASLRKDGTMKSPFSFLKMVAGKKEVPVPFTSMDFFSINEDTASLDFYPSLVAGKRPCVVAIHGGGWMGGYSNEFPELNYCLAKAGYNIAAINL